MMDFLKFQAAITKLKTKPRFGYDKSGDLSKPDVTGLIPNERDYDIGTPSFSRRENVTIVASNVSNKTHLVLQLKWRPWQDGGLSAKNLVTLASELTLSLGDTVYKYEQIETYQPSASPVRKGRIVQYGSSNSNLKLVISSPYRRMRLIFRGHMKQQQMTSDTTDNKDNQIVEDSLTFVKLNLVFSPTGQIFDFYTQYNENCFKRIYHDNKIQRTFERALKDLQFQDRHEQLIRATGEFIVFNNDDNDSLSSKETLFCWGFHARQFSSLVLSSEKVSQGDDFDKLQTKRILGHLNNGQAFHVGLNQINNDKLDFGFTCFDIGPETEPIEQATRIDWALINEDCNKFELEVFGNGRHLNCSATKRFGNLFAIEMNDKPGFAWLSFNDDCRDSVQLSSAMQKSYDDLQEGMKLGLIDTINLTNQLCDGAQKPLVVSIKDLLCTSSGLVGSKASSLALLRLLSSRESNFQVPNGIVLTCHAHDALLDHNYTLKAKIDQLEQLISSGEVENLKSNCEHLRALVEEADFPVALRDELRDRLVKELGGGNQEGLNSLTLAVRSSSWGEDEEDMSAAGQLSTVLGVTGEMDEILRAVKSCFASKFNYANVEYKRQHGLEPSLPMAVIIQVMVECDKAGVMFTCDPTSGNDKVITITANYGLGESVVSGQSEPDLIRVRHTVGGELSIAVKKVGEKRVIIDANSIKADGKSSNQYDRSQVCLADDEVLKLAKCGLNVAKYFQSQRDVEWGFKSHQPYLFQSRPITGLDSFSEHELIHEAEQPSRAELEFSTRANIGEVMPFAISPFNLTCSILFWNISGYRLLGFLLKKTKRFSPEVSSDIIIDSYHNFFRLRCSMIFPMHLKEDKETSFMIKAMEVAFFGHEIGEQPGIVDATRGFTMPPYPFQGLQYRWKTLGLNLRPMAKIMREKSVMTKLRQDVQALKLATGYEKNKMLGLLNQIRNIYKYCLDCWFNHIIIIMTAGNTNMALSGFLSRYIKDPVQLFTVVSKFLGISPDVISAEIPERINRMAMIIKAKGDKEREKFLEMSTNEAIDYLKHSDEQLATEFRVFIEKFGHRCYNEFELAEKSWAEDKGAIVNMLKKNCQLDAKLANSNSERNDIIQPKRLTNLDEVIDSLDFELGKRDRFVLRHLLGPKAQLMVAARERTKDILIEFHDIVRQASRMLAKEMRNNKRIPDEDLFYYLFYDEIEPIIREPQPSLVVQATRRRNMFRKSFKVPWRFDEIIAGYHLVPNHLKANKELTEQVANAPKLYGSTASYGRVQARVSLVSGFQELDKVRAGDILVTHSTDIAFSPIFPLISGIITEVGGLISHGAVVAREYGLPSILGIPDVTRILEDGEEIVLDADNGVITRLDKVSSSPAAV